MENLTVAIVTGLWYWFGSGLPGYTLFGILKSPIVTSFVIGVIMGDPTKALMIGASIEAVYLGMISAGGNMPSDRLLAAVIATPIALSLDIAPELAISIAVPVGILGAFVYNIRRGVNTYFATLADSYAEQGNVKGIQLCAFTYPMLVGFLLRFPIVFIANLYGAEVVSALLNVIPEWIMRGLTVAGGLLPALGFATIIFTIGRNRYIPLFIIGFYVVQYLKISITGTAIFGICIALLAVMNSNNSVKEG